MRVRVANHGIEAMIVAGIQGGLKAVVVRPVEVTHLENITEPGKLRVERTRGLPVACIRAQRFLIDVANSGEVCPVIPDIADFQRESRGESMLHRDRS